MDAERLKNDLICVVERGLQGVCKPAQCALIVRKMAAMPSDIESMKMAARKVRIAVRLLIDEDLAEDLYAEMTTILVAQLENP